MMPGEDIFRLNQSSVERATILDQAYGRAVESLHASERFNPASFSHIRPDVVAHDIAYVQKMKRVFEAERDPAYKKTEEYGAILEAIMYEQIELNEWLGPDVESFLTSEFDDIANGVDTVIEHTGDGGVSHMALAVDVTHGDPLGKLRRIREELERGKLARVKYFRSVDPATGERTVERQLRNIPRVVVGADKDTVLEVAGLWMAGKQKQLSQHPIRLLVLREIAEQLHAYKKILNRGQHSHLAPYVNRQIELLDSTLASQSVQALARDRKARALLEKDKVYASIIEKIEEI